MRTSTLGLLILLLMARFAIPLASLGTDAVFRVFLEQEYEASELALSDATASIRANTPELAPGPQESGSPDEKSVLEQYWDQFKGAAGNLDVTERLENLKRNAGETVDNVVRLIVVFLLLTVVFPLLFLWLAIKLVQFIFRVRLQL